jgi:exosome complex exonuclease RRP6
MPQEMLDYARSDTHFLLFIFDHLLNGLISRSSPRSSPSLNMPPATPAGGSFAVDTPLLLQHVLARSAQTCLRRFAADIYDAEHGLGAAGWFSLAKKYNKLFLLDSAPGTPPAIEGAVYKRLHAWRDATAREEDESTAYVMKNHQLFILAGRKPTTVKELFLMGQQWSEVVRRRADELVDLIRTTTDEAEGAAGPTAAIPMEGIIASAAVAAPAPAKQMVVDVWGAVQEPSAASAAKAPAVASSSLFGPSISSRAAVVPENAVASSSRSYVAPSSSLFGAVGSRAYKMQAAAGSDMFASPSSSKGEAQEDAFLRVLGKINLSINVSGAHASAAACSLGRADVCIQPQPPPPPTPTAPVAAPAQFATVVVAADDIFALPGAEEVPFVPAASRASKPQPSADDRDAIVTVGRPKEKKRKRDKTADAVATGASAVDVKGKGREVSPPPAKVDDLTTPAALNAKVTGKPFDYSAVPNGLDQVVKQDNPNKLKKAKKVKKRASEHVCAAKCPPKQKLTLLLASTHALAAVVQYGDFKRPPQSMAETKKGNKNMTFK